MKKSKKTLLVSALSAVAFTSLTIGTTFALFTDEAKTEVSIQAGKVKVSAALDDAKTYSAEYDPQGDLEDEEGAHYKHVAQEKVGDKYMFANGGWATLAEDGSAINVINLTPGDKFEFTFNLGNSSNVDVKYRFFLEEISQQKTLAKGLKTTLKDGEDEETYAGLIEYASEWKLAERGDEDLGQIKLSIELPMNKGNVYQETTAKFTLRVLEVQGNAHRDDEKEVVTVMEDVVSEPEQAVADAPTVIEALTPEAPVSKVTVKLPANAEYGEDKQIAAGDNLTIEVKDLTVKEEGVEETSLDFDVTVKNNGEVINNFVDDVQVTLDVGQNRTVTGLSHNGQPVEGFTYDPATGLLVFSTKSFSPFRVSLLEGAGVSVFNEEELRAALLNGGRIAIMRDIENMPSRVRLVKSAELIGCVEGHRAIISSDETGTGARCFDISNSSDDHLFNLNITFKNLELVQAKQTGISEARGLSLWGVEDSKIVLDNVAVSSSYYALNVAGGCNNLEIEVKNSSVAAGWCAFQSWSPNVSFEFSNSQLSGLNDKSYGGGWNDFATIVLNQGATNNSIVLNDCSIYTKEASENRQYIISNREDGAKYEFNNCKFFFNDVELKNAEEVLENVQNNYGKSWASFSINDDAALCGVTDWYETVEEAIAAAPEEAIISRVYSGTDEEGKVFYCASYFTIE